MADDLPVPAPVPPPLPNEDNDDNAAALPLLFAETPGEHASLLVSTSSASHQDQESHLIEVSPSLRLHITLAEDTGRNGSLFAFSVWNGSVMLARHLDANPTLVQGKRVIEFGAAGALPSIVALVHECGFVMITDYPDERLLEAIRTSLKDARNEPLLGLGSAERGGGGGGRRVGVQGHLWGSQVGGLLRAGSGRSSLDEEGRRRRRREGNADEADGEGEGMEGEEAQYEVALVGECLWLHDQHHNLLQSLFHTLRPGGIALVCFAHHVPGCEEKDLGFFALAEQRRRYGEREGGKKEEEKEEEEEEEGEGWFEVKKVGEERMGHMHREGAIVSQFLYVMEKRCGKKR